MSHLITIYAVCKFGYFCLWRLKVLISAKKIFIFKQCDLVVCAKVSLFFCPVWSVWKTLRFTGHGIKLYQPKENERKIKLHNYIDLILMKI